jgi:biopolymer transport protein ExbB
VRWLLIMAAGCAFKHGALPGDIDAAGDADVSGWAFKRQLTIDNSGLGALSDFGLLLALDATRIGYGNTQAHGEDVRFADATGTMLAYEIERWTAGGSSIVWVRVPAIAASTATTLWMYYGNPSAADAQRATDVWDTDYVGVWHLADAHDSTGRNTSASHGSTTVAGTIGDAQEVDGNSHYVDTGAADQLAMWTIEVWLKAAADPVVTTSSGPLSRGYNYQMQWNCGGITYCRSVNFVVNSGTIIAQYGTLSSQQWHHVSGRFDGSTVETYVGETMTNSLAATGPPVAENGTTKLGARVDLSGFYAGDIDEVRISRTGRSADYLKAQDRSTGDRYVTYGPEQPNP